MKIIREFKAKGFDCCLYEDDGRYCFTIGSPALAFVSVDHPTQKVASQLLGEVLSLRKFNND